jgi:ribonucleotide reductase alpha subunit
MPTASTSQILGNNEAIEPYTSNLYVRRTLAGEFICVSRHLLNDLVERGIWSTDIKNKLVAHNGSVQNIDEIPHDLKELYKTVWELSQKTIINMSADRGAYIDQSQSLNIHMTNITTSKLSSMHFHAWRKGLKTGMYYLRSKAAVDPIKFSIDHQYVKDAAKLKADQEALVCSLDNREACMSCSG